MSVVLTLSGETQVIPYDSGGSGMVVLGVVGSDGDLWGISMCVWVITSGVLFGAAG